MIATLAPRYVLAKYVPDLGRMEPRNIGVFVWWKGEFCLRFLEPDDVEVNDRDTYERWTTYWTRNTSEEAIRPRRGKPVPKTDPACIDALISTQKGNYILVDSGELMSPIRKKNLPEATEYLFNELVADPKKRSPEIGVPTRKAFADSCSDVLRAAGLDFKTNEPVACVWRGVSRHLHPDYYVGNGTPDVILQRAKMSDERSINSAALLVDALLEHAVVQPSNCRFLIRGQDLDNDTAEEGMKLVERLCGAIDIEDASAVDQVRRLLPTADLSL